MQNQSKSPTVRAPKASTRTADPWPDPESKSGPRWPRYGSRVRTRPRMAGPGLLFFFIFDFSFSLMPLDHEKERCRAKAKPKANKKSTPDFFFFGLDVFFGVGLSFSVLVWPLFFSLPVARQLIESGPSVCWVPVPISGNAVRVGSRGQTRIRSPD